jgi:ssDNA-binding Zn-finger/Zn-ribbon topoisomerase 1
MPGGCEPEDGLVTELIRVSRDCPSCGHPLNVRSRRSDGKKVIGCTGYPACTFTEEVHPQLARVAAELEAARAELRALNERLTRLTAARQLRPPSTWRGESAPSSPTGTLNKNPKGLDANRVVAELLELRAELRTR